MFLILCECVCSCGKTHFPPVLFGILLCFCCVTRVTNRNETSLAYNNLVFHSAITSIVNSSHYLLHMRSVLHRKGVLGE